MVAKVVKQRQDKKAAEQLFAEGKSVTEIATILGISVSAVANWKSRNKWEVYEGAARIKNSLADRLGLLIAIDHKTGTQWEEIDRLMAAVEKIERASGNSTKAQHSEKPNPSPDRKSAGRPKASEKNVITAEMTQDLLSAFLDMLYPHQKAWWQSKDYDNRTILKGRQLGATYYFAIEALIILCLTGKNQIFVSASKKQAAQFRRNIIRVVNKVCGLDLQGDPMRIKLPDHENGDAYFY